MSQQVAAQKYINEPLPLTTAVAGGIYVSTGAATNNITAGFPRDLLENSTMAAFGVARNVIEDAANRRVEYRGPIGWIQAICCFSIDASVNKVVDLWFARNGVEVPGSRVRGLMQPSSDIDLFGFSAFSQANPNDLFTVMCDIDAGNATLTPVFGRLIITRAF